MNVIEKNIKLEYFIRPIKNSFSELLAFWKVLIYCINTR